MSNTPKKKTSVQNNKEPGKQRLPDDNLARFIVDEDGSIIYASRAFATLVNQKQDRLSPLITRGPAMEDGTIPVVVGLKSTADKELRSARGFNLLIAELLGEDLVVRRKYATTW